MTPPRHRRPPEQGRSVDADWIQLNRLGSYSRGLAYVQQRLRELRDQLGGNRHNLAASLRQLEAAWYEIWYEELGDPVSRWSPLKAGVAEDYLELLDACEARAADTRSAADPAAEWTSRIQRILTAFDRGDFRALRETHDRIWREMPVMARVHQFASMIAAMRKAVANECREPVDTDVLLLIQSLDEPESVAGPAVVAETVSVPLPSATHPDRVPTRRRLQPPSE